MDPDGTNPKQLTDGASDTSPICSPDAKWVYYDDRIAERIKRVPLDGGTPEVVPGTVVPDAFPASTFSISRDGKFLVAQVAISPKGSNASSVHKIVLVSLDAAAGQSAQRIIDPDPRLSGGVEFSPDGKALVYPVTENGVDNLWVQPLDSGSAGSHGRQITQFSSDNIIGFHFSPDGKSLLVVLGHTDSDVVLLRDLGAGSR